MSVLNIQINSARKATQYESVKSIVLPSIDVYKRQAQYNPLPAPEQIVII